MRKIQMLSNSRVSEEYYIQFEMEKDLFFDAPKSENTLCKVFFGLSE